TSELDLEFTEDSAREPNADPTDIIPPSHRIDESSILDVEVAPGELTGELTGGYDMSIIVDATKQPIGSYDRTAQDLQAVRVDDEEFMVEDQTLGDDVGLKVLEQDYEDQLSATQALNLEIERAARELAERMDEDDLGGTLGGTLEQPMVEMTQAESMEEDLLDDRTMETAAIDETVFNKVFELPPVPDAEHNTKLTATLPTDIEAENDPSASDTGTQETLEMAAAGSDITIELQVETGIFNTKK
ncbi:MAG TPA: hypothetical protein VKQ06_14165, partial [Gammaproteobacteria bacterium]|nr:hypothetical protein [Gammaproteobacteria bacterium]